MKNQSSACYGSCKFLCSVEHFGKEMFTKMYGVQLQSCYCKWLPSRGHLCPVPSFLVESSDSSCQWNASRSAVHHFLAQGSVCLHHSLPFWSDVEPHSPEGRQNPRTDETRTLMHSVRKPALLPESLHGADNWIRNKLLLSFWGLFVSATTWLIQAPHVLILCRMLNSFIGEKNTHSDLRTMGRIGNLDMSCGLKPREKEINPFFVCDVKFL